jgi:hypothetical protein
LCCYPDSLKIPLVKILNRTRASADINWKKYGICVQRIIFHMLENVMVGITYRRTEPALTLESDADRFPVSFVIVK